MKVREEARELVRKAHALDIKSDEKDYISLLTQATAADPFYIEPYIMLGFHYFKEHDYEKAQFNLNRALELDLTLEGNEDNAEKVYITLGKTYQMFQNKEKSLFSFKTFVGLFPKSPHSEKILKQIYLKVQGIEHRYAFFREGYEYFLAGKYEKAVQSFRHSIEGHEVFSWPYYQKGRALIALELYEEAIEAYLEALEHDEHFIFHYALYEAHEMLGEHENAGKHFRKALELNPFHALMILDTAERHLQANEFGKAEKLIEKVLVVEPNQEIVEMAKSLQKQLPGHKNGHERAQSEPASSHEEAKDSQEELERAPSAGNELPPSLAAYAKKAKDKYSSHIETLFAEIRGRLDAEMESRLEKASLDAVQIWERIISGERHREEELILKMKTEAEALFRARQNEAQHEREALLEKARNEARKLIEEAEIKAETITSVAQKKRAEEEKDIENRRKRSEEKSERIVSDGEAKAASIIKEAKHEADRILEKADRSLEEKRKQILKEANLEADEIVEEAYRKVEAAEERLYMNIENKVADAIARLSEQSEGDPSNSANDNNNSSQEKSPRGKKGKR
ncbi:MAG: hypothetical protein AB9903_12220 [Vulcanimicrobiota bacterium]